MAFEFPSTIYDKPRQLLAALGSFWNYVFAEQDQMSGIADAKGSVESQSMLDLMETIAAMSRYEVPIFHRDNWYALRLLESERNNEYAAPLRYNEGATYDGSHYYNVAPERPLHAFPKPAELVGITTILDRFIEPSLVWINGVDFQIDTVSSAVVFVRNPFEDARLIARPVYQDGQVVDREIYIWIFRGSFDWETVYRQFGYALGMRMQSSNGYRQLMNAVLDAIAGGTADIQIRTAVSAITGISIATEATEVVTNNTYDGTNRLVITDKAVYKFPLASLPTVAVGDTVHAGDTLTDQFQIYEFNRGITPDELAALSMGRGMLANCYYGPLVFENKSLPLVVNDRHPSGYTYVSFGLGGFPLDVRKFFDEVHERGTVEAEREIDPCETVDTVTIPGDPCDDDNPTQLRRRGTLAHLLDTRVERVGEPTAESLPATINPLQFLVQNVLRGNTFVVYIKTAGLTVDALGWQHLRWIHRIIPPATAVLFVIELTSQSETIDPATYVNDTQTAFLDATEPLHESVAGPSVVNDERIWAHYVSTTCS